MKEKMKKRVREAVVEEVLRLRESIVDAVLENPTVKDHEKGDEWLLKVAKYATKLINEAMEPLES